LWLTSPLVVACFLDLKTEAGSTVWEPQHTISMCVRTWPSAHQAMLTYPIAEEHTDSSRRANYLFRGFSWTQNLKKVLQYLSHQMFAVRA
jgi:hypothetical protein